MSGLSGEPEQNPLRQHRSLVILVVAMGVMLVVGLTIIAVTIIYRISSSDSQQNDTAAMAAADVGEVAGEIYAGAGPRLAARDNPATSFARPAGAALIGATTSSGDRLTLHFRNDSGDIIMVVDLASGRVLSRIDIAAEGAAAAE